jgi:hypothetical protein
MKQADEAAVKIIRFIAHMRLRMIEFAIVSGRESTHVCTHSVEVECVDPEETTGLLITGYVEISIASGEFMLWDVDISFDGLRWEVETEITRNDPDNVVEASTETTEQLEDLPALFDRSMELWKKAGSIDEILSDATSS